ncbi:MAG: FAD-dependent oxidoreductase [Mesosutterella sp.]|nr:FAD-dependent oxidoreductase [Mesosutterella sp.]
MKCRNVILAAALAAAFATPALAADRTLSTDIVVIGAGCGGTAAGEAAIEKGAKVIMLEKQGITGGTCKFSEGIMAVESKMQRDWNYGLTKDQAFQMIMRYGHWRGNGRVVRTFVEKTASTIDWMQSNGVEFEKLFSNYPDGLYTWHIYKGRGAGWLAKYQDRFVKQGGQLLLNTPATGLIQGKDGVVRGVIATEKDGSRLTINAKAVIIATGGFGANKEMMQKYMRFPGVDGLAQTGKTGDGIQMAWKAGADKDGTEVQASYRPGPKGVGTTNQVAASAKQPHLWLNPHGDRFVDETVMLEWPFAGNALERNGGKMWVVYDSDTLNYMKTKGIDLGVGVMVPVATKLTKFDQEWGAAEAAGWAKRADTLDELAAKTGMDPKLLKKNVDEYNGYADIRHDGLFAKSAKYLRPVRKAPFYAIQLVATSLGTLGGIKIDDKWEVVRPDGSAIKGLYAAGNDAGGMYGDSYDLLMAGSTIAWAVNGGRIAAESAVKYIGK